MTIFHTVVPLSAEINLGANARFDLAGGVRLTSIPSWVAKQEILGSVSDNDQWFVQHSTHALVVEYQADALSEPDQEAKYELCVLANLALWLSQPSPVCFKLVIHAPQFEAEPVARQISRHSPLLCHRKDLQRRVVVGDMSLVTALHANLVALDREGGVLTAVRATWAGLQMNIEAIRYALFWVALEALFGPEDAREITYRLSQRVGFFLGNDRAEAKDLFALAKKGYAFRSRIVHGRWKQKDDSESQMAEIESLVRRSLVRVLGDDQLRRKFSSNAREAFLDDLVFVNR